MNLKYNYRIPEHPELYTARELAEELGCSVNTIRNMAKNGQIERITLERPAPSAKVKTYTYEDLPDELWEPVKDYPGYWVSSCGRVRKGNRLKSTGKTGYPHVGLTRDRKRKTIAVHRLVAEAFLDDWDPALEVDHIDGDPTNNHVNNLEMVSHAENMRRCRIRKSTAKRPVRNIDTGEVFESVNAAARAYDLSPGNLSWCCEGRHQSCGEYHWEYVDTSKDI